MHVRSIRFVLMGLALSSLASAEADPLQPPESRLPRDAAALVNAYEADVQKIRDDADKAVLTRTEKFRPALVKAQEAATKKGDLDGALAIKEVLDGLPKVDESKRPRPPSTSKDVVLYSQTGFQGPGTIVKQFDTIIEVYKIGFPNDGLRSIKVPDGYTVIVYQGDLGGGAEYVIDRDVSDLTGTPALGTTSFMIKRRK